MDQTLFRLNQLELRVTDIQYLPYHRCPQCGAPPRTTETGAWMRPYQDWFGTALSGWLDHLGYVYFQCDCRHHPQFQGSLRVARLGDAILSLNFDDGTVTRQAGLEPAMINADRVRQAVNFLAQNADPAFTAGSDWLAHELYALAAGGISPEAAWLEVQEWIDHQIGLALQRDQDANPALELVNLDLGTR
jgi:hypothetical protein